MHSPTTAPRLTALGVLAVLALTTAACGTRVDRDAYLASRRVILPEGAAGDLVVRSGSELDGETSVGDASASGGSGAAPAGAGSTVAGSGAEEASPGVPAGVSAKVVGDTVRIGMHLPETGAAPLPTDWLDALKVIQQYLNERHPAHGRTYEFVVEDDGYDPAKGLAACRKLADENVLLVLGHSQPAVQEACAGLLDDRRIPYMMRGAQASILDGRPLAWMGTITDDRQGRMLGDYAIRHLGGKDRKGAVLYENDQLASRDGFIDRYEVGGGRIVLTEETVPRQSDFSATIEKLRQAGAEIVFLSMPPVDVIKLSVQAQGQGYHPTWVGGATYWNYNLVLESAGAALDGAVTFSPWPTVDSAAAATYRNVYAHYRPGKEATDVGLVMWGWAVVIRTIVEQAGPNLSRLAVAEALQNLKVNDPTWNPLTFGPNQHGGSTSVAVFTADGQAKRWRQITGFAGSF